MNGHFEVEQSQYPIGALPVEGGYKVTDMRSLNPLHSQPIQKRDAYALCARVNSEVRKGGMPQTVDASAVREFVEAEVSAL